MKDTTIQVYTPIFISVVCLFVDMLLRTGEEQGEKILYPIAKDLDNMEFYHKADRRFA